MTTKVLENTDEEILNSYSYYVKSYASDDFNLKFFSSIIRETKLFKKENFKLIQTRQIFKKVKFISKLKRSVKPLFGEFLLLINKLFIREFILVVDPYYSKNYFVNSLWFFFKSRGKIIHYVFNRKHKETITTNRFLRRKLKIDNLSKENELLYISSKLLFKYIPKSYLEEFLALRKFSTKWHLKNKNCKGFFTANSIHSDEIFKYVVAFDQKVPLSIIQHGAGYGMSKFISAEDYETSLSSKFYSWGWSKYKLSHPKLNFYKQTEYLKNDRIVLTFPSLSSYSGIIESLHLNYVEKEIITNNTDEFIQNVDPKIKQKKFKMELKYNFMRELKLQNNIKDDTYNDFQKSLKDTRIHITNHFGTPFLESIAMNIPTIMILNNYENHFRDEVLKIINEMKSQKIIFDNSKLASQHINKFYNSVNEWWERDTTQFVLKKFRNKFCITSENWKKSWLESFEINN